jgi:hypothetical protein
MSGRQLKVSRRNLIWLVAVVAAGLVGAIIEGWQVGLVAAAVVLVISEVVERMERSRRARSG